MTTQYPGPAPQPTPPAAPPPLPIPPGAGLQSDADIQGNIFAGFNKDYAALLFLQLKDQTTGRAYLTDLVPLVANNADVSTFNAAFSQALRSSGSDPDNLNATWVGVSITAPGLETLVPQTVQNSLQNSPFRLDPTVASFLAGAAADSAVVAQQGPEAPANWYFGRSDQPIHVILSVESDTASSLLGIMQELGQLASKHEVVTIFQQDGATLPGARHGHEHFGFKDGISQPAVQGFVTTDPDGQPLIAPGEFVLGFPGQGPSRANGRAVPQWMFKGSFLVIRRIAQDVAGWWNQAEQLAPAAGIGAEALGAKLVGRWRDGTPLDLDPNNDPRSGADQSTSNAFDYSDDADGAKVPLFVHIRKVNPRKAAAPGPGVTDQHRIIRRGIPFGDPFDPASGKDHGPDAERGLVFACYQASIPDQFSFLQRTWADNSDFPTPGAGPDPVIGPKGTCPLAETSGTPVPLSVGQFVKIEGATYSFTPSISTLQQLASGQLS